MAAVLRNKGIYEFDKNTLIFLRKRLRFLEIAPERGVCRIEACFERFRTNQLFDRDIERFGKLRKEVGRGLLGLFFVVKDRADGGADFVGQILHSKAARLTKQGYALPELFIDGFFRHGQHDNTKRKKRNS